MASYEKEAPLALEGISKGCEKRVFLKKSLDACCWGGDEASGWDCCLWGTSCLGVLGLVWKGMGWGCLVSGWACCLVSCWGTAGWGSLLSCWGTADWGCLLSCWGAKEGWGCCWGIEGWGCLLSCWGTAGWGCLLSCWGTAGCLLSCWDTAGWGCLLSCWGTAGWGWVWNGMGLGWAGCCWKWVKGWTCWTGFWGADTGTALAGSSLTSSWTGRNPWSISCLIAAEAGAGRLTILGPVSVLIFGISGILNCCWGVSCLTGLTLFSPNTVSWEGSKIPDKDWPKVCLEASLLETGVGLGVVTETAGWGSWVLCLALGVLGGAARGASVGLGLILILCLCFVSKAGAGLLAWLVLGSGLLSGTLEVSTLH